MAKLVLHIGTGKTGSSYLQRHLWANRTTLERQGWNYPSFLNNENHVQMCLPFENGVTAAHLQRSMTDAPGKARAAEHLAAQLGAQVRPPQRWIISTERFCGRLHSAAEVRAAIDFFRRFFDEITVLVFFRRQEFALLSAYSQWIKGGGSGEWGWDFCNRRLHRFDCDAVFDRWAGSVGAENIRALPYLEAGKRDPGRLVEQFAGAAGITVGADWIVPAEPLPNPALSAEGMAFLRAINPSIPRLNPDNTSNDARRQVVIGRVMEMTAGPGFLPGHDVIDAVANHYASSNARLLKKVPNDPAWQEWLGQSPATSGTGHGAPGISVDRVVELMIALSEPNGPIAWGRATGRPARMRQIVSERLSRRLSKGMLHRRPSEAGR